MKKLLSVILCALFLLGCVAALADDSAHTDTPPAEVSQHLAEKFADYTLEDYIAIPGTPNGDYGFALIASGRNRVLLGYHAENGVMRYWRKSAGAVPQGEGVGFFSRHSANTVYEPGTTDKTFGDTLGFTVAYLDSVGAESWTAYISYHWQDGGFKLFSYSDLKSFEGAVLVTDRGVAFYDSDRDKVAGRVDGTVQRDLRYTSYAALPKTLNAARNQLTVAPEIPVGQLNAQEIRFIGGQRYDVYSIPSNGPGSLRGGNGKAAVSTNDWIQVFGEEDGWILIQYAIDKGHMRFGYIPADALPAGAKVDTLDWKNAKTACLAVDTPVTDDPLYSRSELTTLPAGARVTALATMGDWMYIESSTGDFLRGFVKQDALCYDKLYFLSDHSDNLADGILTVTPDGRIKLTMGLKGDSSPASFLLKDELQNIEIGVAERNALGDYALTAPLPANTTSISFIPLDNDGNPNETLFRVEW